MVLSGLLMGSRLLCVLERLCWTKTTGGWIGTDQCQGALSIMWSIHRDGAVCLISFDEEMQTLVQCWRAHPTHHPHAAPDYLFNAVVANFNILYIFCPYNYMQIYIGVVRRDQFALTAFLTSPKKLDSHCLKYGIQILAPIS